MTLEWQKEDKRPQHNWKIAGKVAVDGVLEGRKNEMVGVLNREVAFTNFEKEIKHNNKTNKELLLLAESLA